MEMRFSVSHTTRTPRAGEIDGKDYHFVSHETFQGMLSGDEFLEWAEVHNNYYGTARTEVVPRLERGIDVIMDVDVQGAERIMGEYPEAHSIFIMPPSHAELELRLRGRTRRSRRSEPPLRRISMGNQTLRSVRLCYHQRRPERASWALAAIVIEKRQRRERVRARAERVLADFQRAQEARREP